MLDEREFNRWIAMALKTLDSAIGDLERGDYNWACFKAQQAAEFAVKALLRGLGLLAYGHSISRLLKENSDLLGVPSNLIQAALELDRHYIPTRYPNAWPDGAPFEYYTRDDAEVAVKNSKAIIEWVIEK